MLEGPQGSERHALGAFRFVPCLYVKQAPNLAAYDPDRGIRWVHRPGSSEGGSATSIVVYAQGDLYAGGWFKGVLAGLQITGDPSGFLLRYSLEGDLVR